MLLEDKEKGERWIGSDRDRVTKTFTKLKISSQEQVKSISKKVIPSWKHYSCAAVRVCIQSESNLGLYLHECS